MNTAASLEEPGGSVLYVLEILLTWFCSCFFRAENVHLLYIQLPNSRPVHCNPRGGEQ